MTRKPADERPRLGPNDAVIDEAFALSVLPRRSFGAHKWGVGGLVIVAGAPNFVGAPALCAQAAGRAGAGIINVAVPRGAVSAIAALVPEAAYILLPDSEATGAGRRAVELIAAKLEKSRALVIGPGLGEDEAADALLTALLGGSRPRPANIGFAAKAPAARAPSASGAPSPIASGKPVLVDADGLNWLAKQERWWELLAATKAVLTPHVGEMARLLKTDAKEITGDPIGTVRAVARDWGQVVALKYGYTAVSDGSRTFVAPDAPLSLATAGSGDVFAGVIGAFLAQGLAPLDAAALAIYVGGKAARRVEQRTGVLGLVASDLPFAVATELAVLEAKREASGG